ncbi:methyltransferase domain-containing protein [Saxibacter everestensis]|uniref:Methyltransferase domain-containing protein n=1 Tax=Saxibacter everestensis TaxID=2909229 RepID=A0ABY8QPT0_9MICO|nr:methyltransferase domain-containing protein [Brevibacteriaceae bacterium ZFBP1038]
MAEDTYTHGHHPSVLRAHSWRTAENSAAYLLSSLTSTDRLLDVGCGPGTITIGFAERVREVVGIDAAAEPLTGATALAAEHGLHNVEFGVGDVYSLDFDDNSFDVVHAHQVLQHLSDPVRALREMARVARPGGIVAVRDADYSGMIWYPMPAELDEWMTLYQKVARSNSAEPDAGRRLLSWAKQAGFTDIVATADTWCYASDEERAWWGGSWAERVVNSSFAKQAIERGFADPAKLEELSRAWGDWAQSDDGWFAIVNGEVLCRVPDEPRSFGTGGAERTNLAK